METIGDATLYLTSVHEKDGGAYFMVRDGRGRHFVAAGGEYELFNGEDFDADGVSCRCCPLTAENAAVLMKLFPFTAPSCHRGRPTTLGLGDRLGLASGGHIQTVRDRNVFPVLAQQSMRELNLTGRTYPDVLAAAAFAVFQEDYRGGYGAEPTGYPGGPSVNENDGTIPVFGALASIVFTPAEALSTMENYARYPELWGEYGFKTSYNLDQNYFCPYYYGIDKGNTMVMLSNHADEFVWRMCMKNERIQEGLQKCGLRKN
jgi:hypothetical protein